MIINSHRSKKVASYFVTLFLIVFLPNSMLGQSIYTKTYDLTGTHFFIVPQNGPYQVKITCIGADGGNKSQSTKGERGGSGAIISATYTLSSGDLLTSIVGTSGRSGEPKVAESAGGGGGGTGVVLNSSKLLLVAGGGGGASKLSAGLGGRKLQETGAAGVAGIAGGGGSFQNPGGEKSTGSFGGGGGKLVFNTLAFGGMGSGIGGGGGGAGFGGGGGAGGGKIGFAGGGGGGYTGGKGAADEKHGGEGGSSYLSDLGQIDLSLSKDGINSGASEIPSAGKVIIELFKVGESIMADQTKEVLDFATKPEKLIIAEPVPVQPATPRYVGLFIAIDNYLGEWDTLKNSVYDAVTIGKLLKEKYGFTEIATLYNQNATRARIIDYLSKFMEEAKPLDNLLIFYAGHGVEMDGVGYWVPASAAGHNTSELISNTEIENILGKTDAKHVLALVDAAFTPISFKSSDKISRTKMTTAYYEQVDGLISRQAITSGGAKPTNMDDAEHSIFVKYLLKFLEKNNQSHLDSQTLFDKIFIPVLANSPNRPEIGIIENAGHKGGQFIFKLKK